jgi:hypothetical protein
MTNEPSKETIMKTIKTTIDSDLDDLDSALLSRDRVADEIKNAIIHRVDPLLTEGDRKIFPAMIQGIFRHELLNIARIAISHGSQGLQISETKKLILRVFDSNSETFKLSRPLDDSDLCAFSLALIACDTINAYLAPIKSFFTFDQVEELLEIVITDIRDAIDCLDLDSLF